VIGVVASRQVHTLADYYVGGKRLAACPDTGLNLDIIGEVLYLVSG
jgi:hypothetical protein